MMAFPTVTLWEGGMVGKRGWSRQLQCYILQPQNL